MTTETTKCAIMFADVAGSTKLYEAIGDVDAKSRIGACLEQLREATETHGGSVIKTIGDELMCRFENANDAVLAARVMQEVTRASQSAMDRKLSIRTGIHYGSVIVEDGDLFGDAVNTAARMTSVARGGQVITTQDTVAELSPELAGSARPFDIAHVKGKRDEIAIFEVQWESDDQVTKLATKLASRGRTRLGTLVLKHGPTEKTLAATDGGALSIGRDAVCSLVVETGLASRQHARCEFRRGKFVLIDESTNGTYVRTANGNEVYLRREELVLQQIGVICLGQSVKDADQASWIQFRIE